MGLIRVSVLKDGVWTTEMRPAPTECIRCNRPLKPNQEWASSYCLPCFNGEGGDDE